MRALLRRLRAGRSSERGTSAIELALLVPVFLLIVVGTLDFGQAILLYNMTGEAAREGARVAQVQVSANPTPGATPVISTAQATAIASAARYEAAGLGSQLQVTPIAGLDANNGPYVQVVVRANYQPVAARFLGVNNVPVAATSQLYLP